MRKLISRYSLGSRIGAVSIRTKVLGIVAASILISSMAFILSNYNDMQNILRNQLRERGIAIGNSLAVMSRDLILTNDQFSLYTLTKDTLLSNKDVAYIFVLNNEGDVLVHTFKQGFPSGLLGKNRVSPNEPYSLKTLETEDGIIQDIAVPVLGGTAGVVRLGISETGIRSALFRHAREQLVWMLLIVTAGLYVAYNLTSFLTGPISKLAEAARSIGKGNFPWNTPVWAKDDIGSLGATLREVSEEIRRKEEMQEQLLLKVINAQEDERKRIARELHDEIGQSLTTMKISLKYIEESSDTVATQKKIEDVRILASQILENVRLLSAELRPSLLDELGLVAALQTHIKQYSSKIGINVDFYTSGFDKLHFSTKIEVTVFRIIQEALTNIAKYSGATNVSVILRYRNASLVAIVEDDGKGFDVNKVMALPSEKRLGLFGMHERAYLAGGKLTIESEPGMGTTIYLELPDKLGEAQDEQDKALSSR